DSDDEDPRGGRHSRPGNGLPRLRSSLSARARAGLGLAFVHQTPELALHTHAAPRKFLEAQLEQTELVVLPQRVEPGSERVLETAGGRLDVAVLELQPQLAHVLVLLVANRDLPVARDLGDLVHEGLEDRRIHALASEGDDFVGPTPQLREALGDDAAGAGLGNEL